MTLPLPKIPSLVERVQLCKPFNEASRAIKDVEELIDHCVTTEFQGTPALDRKADYYLCFGGFSFFYVVPAGGIAMSLGAPAAVVGIAMCLTIPTLMIGLPIYAFLAFGPQSELRRSCKRVLAAASALPVASQESLVELMHSARRAFHLGKISLVQDKILSNTGQSLRRLRFLERRGIRLVDKAARELRLNENERQCLREAFRAGNLPPVQTYVDAMRENSSRARRVLDSARMTRFSAA